MYFQKIFNTFVIAEAGVNHNGDMKLAKRLIKEAANAGANAVKFQTFKTDNIVTRAAELARKLDIEGQEMHALQGAKGSLGCCALSVS